MNEINKENDIFVSTILNPTSDVRDLISNGINTVNTGILDKETYKESEFVKRTFSDENGVFNNDLFDKVYAKALKTYSDLSSIDVYNNLSEYSKYSEGDIYAPIQSDKISKQYEILKVRNPLRVSEGVTSIFGKGESKKSNRELAQMHKVWDSENEKWLDYTAEDQGFLGLNYLVRPSLVYATWDEDGTHFDKFLGRTVQHRKGEWKTDDDGQFYCETIGDKLSYGKEFVAYSDILTKEDSWANKIDVFDSDDKKKSLTGMIFKEVAAIAPYMIPGIREIWGGVTAAINLSSVMPAFGKMLEGLALGDGETKFTKKMNLLENYWSKFNDSLSDEGKSGMFTVENMLGTVSDIFGQLYQMRAAASLSNLYSKRFTKALAKSFDAFDKKFGELFNAMKRANPSMFKTEDGLIDIWKELAEHTPEMKDLIAKQSKLSKSLSLGYMALTSSADVYQEAIESGYDRRMAGLAGIIAVAGQYGIMMNNRMGDWFLDATTGYKENVSRNLMKKTLRPYYDKIAKGVDDINLAKTSELKLNIFAKIYDTVWNNGLKKAWTLVKDGGEEYWKRSIIEGVEEVTEEAVMDTTKAMFDGLSMLGVGKNSETARFNAILNTFSAEGALRYLMNFIGGVMGGALFEFQGKVVQPWIDSVLLNKANPETTYSLVKEIMNGNTQELIDEVDRITKSDNQAFSFENGESQSVPNGANTRGKVIGDALKNYIKFVESVVVDNGINLSDDKIISKAVRDKMLLPIIELSEVTDIILNDFTKLATELAAAQAKVNEKVEISDKKDKTDLNKSTEESELNKESDQNLIEDLNSKKLKISDFLSGKNQEYYLKLALLYLHPVIRNSVLNADKYSYTKSKYNVDYKDLPQTAATLSKESIDAEYAEWKNKSNEVEKFREVGVNVYDDIQLKFSKAILEYASTNYKDIRKIVVDKVLRGENFSLAEIFSNTQQRQELIRFSLYLSAAGLPGFNLEDKLLLSPEFKEELTKDLVHINEQVLDKSYESLEKARKDLLSRIPKEKYSILGISEDTLSKEDYKNQFFNEVLKLIQTIPVESLDALTVNNILAIANESFGIALTESILKDKTDLTGSQAKVLVDLELVKLGYSPDVLISFSDDNFLMEALQYITAITAPKLNDDTIVLNVSKGILKNYIDTQEVIDHEIIRNLKKQVIKDILKIYPKLINSFRLQDPMFRINPDGAKNLETTLVSGLNQNESIENCILNWVYKMCETQPEYLQDPMFIDFVINDCLYIINSEIPSVSLYEAAILKESRRNPLFEALRTIGMQVFDGDDVKIFDLIERESDKMQEVSDITEYIRQGITKESIDNFLLKLDLLDSLIAGMEDSEIDHEHMIAYNVQMKRFADKYNEGKNSDNYKTISTENVHSIAKDIDLLRNKLQFAKILIETNTESKVKLNLKTKLNFEKYFVNHLLDKASELKIDGVSIMPPLDEVERKETDEEKLALIESTIHNKVKELIKSGKSALSIISTIFDSLGVNKKAILNSGLFSNGLNSDWTVPTEYDFFVYLTTILSSDTLEFDYNFKEVISKDSFKYLPFFTLEYAAKTLYSFAKDDLGLHDAAVKWLYSNVPTNFDQETSRIFFINGIAGAGKTSAVMSIVSAMLGDSKVIISAPNTTQAQNLKNSLSTLALNFDKSPVMNLSELMKFFLTEEGIDVLENSIKNPNSSNSIISTLETSYGRYVYRTTIDDKYIKPLKRSDIPDYVFIDEATHFNQAQLVILDTVAKKYGFKILTAGDTSQKGAVIAGDTSQKGAVIAGDPVNINDIFSWKCPAMTISVRSSNIHKKDNVDNLQSRLRRAEEVFLTEGYDINNPNLLNIRSNIEIKYHQSSNTFDGDKIVNNITVEDLKSIKEAAELNNGRIMVIAQLDATGDIADLDLKTKLFDAGIKSYDVYTTDDLHSKAVQGAEADYVIIDSLPPVTNNWHLDLISLYTYLSRSLRGTLVKDNGSYTAELGILNTSLNYTGLYELPGKDLQVEIKGQRIEELTKIIGDYKPKAPLKKQQDDSQELKEVIRNEQSNLSESELKEVRSLQTEGEEKSRLKQIPEMEGINSPISDTTKKDSSNSDEKTDDLNGYGFYNHIGARVDNGRYTCVNNNIPLDLDGLLPDKTLIRKNIIRGFIKFKNLIALYSDIFSNYFKQGIRDNDILDFLFEINPEISDAENIIDRRNDVYDYYIGNEDNPGQLQIDEDSYIYVKRYNANLDSSLTTPDYSLSKSANNGELLASFGRRIYTKDGKINLYITCGVLPKLSTLERYKKNISFDKYAEFLKEAEELLKNKNFIAFKSSHEFKPKTSITFRKNPGKFYSIDYMLNELNITFDSYTEGDNAGKPKIGIITPDISTVNRVESFSFLHYIASLELSTLPYADRIQLLESAFVKVENNKKKLLVSGKYYAIANFVKANDNRFKKVIVLEPEGWSYHNALKFQNDLLHKLSDTEGDTSKRSILETRATAMSLNSLLKLLTAVFKSLGAIDNNGIAINSGVKEYVELTIEHLLLISSSKLKLIADSAKPILDNWDKDFDMDFISNIMKQTHVFGILLMDHIIKFDGTTLKVKKLGDAPHSYVDVDFDLSQTSYREFRTGFSSITESIGELLYRTYETALSEDDYNHLGLADHFIEMPMYSFPDNIFGEVKLVETTLTHEQIDFTNSSKITTDESEKPIKTDSTISELAKTFDPETLCHYFVPDKKYNKKNSFYRESESLTLLQYLFRRKKENRHTYVTNPDETNGFELQQGDYVQVAGDTTHVYRIRFIDNKKKILKFDLKDGKPIVDDTDKTTDKKKQPEISCKFNQVSAIVGREIPNNGNPEDLSRTIKYDFYQLEKWKNFVKEKNGQTTNSSKIITETNFTDSVIKEIIKTHHFLILYRVMESDETAVSPINILQNSETDSLPEGWIAINVNTDENKAIAEIKEAISKLKEIDNTDDINGIAILGLFDKVTNFSTPEGRKKLFSELKEDHIAKYISFTTSPKFNKKDTPKKKSKKESNRPVDVKIKEKESPHSKVETLLKTISSFDELINELEKLVSADTLEELKEDYSNRLFTLYKGSDEKFHIIPKLKFIKNLNNSDLENKILKSLPDLEIKEGDLIQSMSETGDWKNAKVISISTDTITVSQEGNNGIWYNKDIPLFNFKIAYGVVYKPNVQQETNSLKLNINNLSEGKNDNDSISTVEKDSNSETLNSDKVLNDNELNGTSNVNNEPITVNNEWSNLIADTISKNAKYIPDYKLNETILRIYNILDEVYKQHDDLEKKDIAEVLSRYCDFYINANANLRENIINTFLNTLFPENDDDIVIRRINKILESAEDGIEDLSELFNDDMTLKTECL